jgi:hypothetical protein
VPTLRASRPAVADLAAGERRAAALPAAILAAAAILTALVVAGFAARRQIGRV